MTEPGLDVEHDAMPTPATIDIRNLSVKCGNCETYQTLAEFSRGDDRNIYTYLCENDICDPEVTRTLVEVPVDLDVFARRDPGWRGGTRHAGGEAEGAGESPLQVVEFDPFGDD